MNTGTAVTLPIVIVSGFLDGLNPCAFSVLLSFAAILLAGVGLAEARPRLWRVGGTYLLGMFLTYLLLGLGIVTAVAPLVRMHLAVRIMGVAVVALGLWMLKDMLFPGVGWTLAMPARWHGVVRRSIEKTTAGGTFVAGALVGLCTVPCSGAIYVGILALIARQPLGTRLGYLVLYNLMYIAPLAMVLAAVNSRFVLNRLGHAYVHRKATMKAAMGLLTLALGFLILFTA
ncbi:MAG: hypothetical protein HY660_01865 [Armatimonadetes bacterium]|nr:hypothetical protein [Armatimonadota bacterium]